MLTRENLPQAGACALQNVAGNVQLSCAKQTMPQIPVCVGRLKAEPLRAGYRSLGNPPSHNSRTSLAARRLAVTTLLGSTKTWG